MKRKVGEVVYRITQEHIDMWHRGWSCHQIADSAGCHRATVCRAFRRAGLDLLHRPQPVVEEAIRESRRLRAEGVVMRDIADIIGYSRRTIQRWLNPKVVD